MKEFISEFGYDGESTEEYKSEIDEHNFKMLEWVCSPEYQEWLSPDKITPETRATDKFPSIKMHQEECYTRPRTKDDPIGAGIQWSEEIYAYLNPKKE